MGFTQFGAWNIDPVGDRGQNDRLRTEGKNDAAGKLLKAGKPHLQWPLLTLLLSDYARCMSGNRPRLAGKLVVKEGHLLKKRVLKA